jgi:16S rRNA (adenine1518-N6/adenine1519-N6)-dimethyltransferase
MILTPDQIKLRLKKLGVRTDKYLGQHFLISEDVLHTIIKEAQPLVAPNDSIVEVGPGLGVLTEQLLKFGNPVWSVEKDPVFASALPSFLGDPSALHLLKGDILEVLDKKLLPTNTESWVVVANIPYAITSPLLRKLVHYHVPPHHILVLVQKEAAERITAAPGSSKRGLLTIQIEIMAESQIITNVTATSFWPVPEVESTLLLLTLRPTPLVEREEIPHVIHTVIAGFSSKRKQLLNSLSGGLNQPTDVIRKALRAAQIDPQRRAETLTIDEWVRLTDLLNNSV